MGDEDEEEEDEDELQWTDILTGIMTALVIFQTVLNLILSQFIDF